MFELWPDGSELQTKFLNPIERRLNILLVAITMVKSPPRPTALPRLYTFLHYSKSFRQRNRFFFPNMIGRRLNMYSQFVAMALARTPSHPAAVSEVFAIFVCVDVNFVASFVGLDFSWQHFCRLLCLQMSLLADKGFDRIFV